MPKMKDRLRLKDQILESIGKVIRIIQDSHSRSGDTTFELRNSDWELHKLVEHLDHAFLHGLRHVTNGYWALVEEFTVKSTVADIKQLSHVMTNLGKSRVWLYQALNDQLLECYTKCYLENQDLVRKFYVKEALVMDEQRLHVLLTLVSGLELICFKLDIDVPYLDLASHIKHKNSECDEDDQISLSSQDSSLSQSLTDPFDESSSSLLFSSFQRSLSLSQMGNTKTPVHRNMSLPGSYDSTSATSDAIIDASLSIEVTHITSQKGHRRKPTRRKVLDEEAYSTQVESSSLNSFDVKSITSDQSSFTVTPTSPESGYRSVAVNENQSSRQKDFEDEAILLASSPVATSLNNNNTHETLHVKNMEGLTKNGINSTDCQIKVTPVHVKLVTELNWTEKELQLVQSLESQARTVPLNEQRAANFKEINSSENSPSSSPELTGIDDCDSKLAGELSDSAHVISDSIYDRNTASVLKDTPPNKDDVEDDVVSSQSNSQRDDEITQSVKGSSHSKSKNGKKASKSMNGAKRDHEAEVLVDNNLMLLLMLEVFESSDEKLLKMYQSCLGHTDGDVQPVYLLLSDSAIYLITTQFGQRKFKKVAVVKHRELDYISLSLNYQVINIVCTNRRKQFWITTGDEELTRCIVSHLDLSIRTSETALSALHVLTDATTQKIAMRKWLLSLQEAEDSKQPSNDILLYCLVNWCDLNTSESPASEAPMNRDGVLFYQTEATLFFNSYWKKAYFVLRDGFLYQYADRHANQSPQVSLQLNQDNCVGCRHCRFTDRKFGFEVILSNGTSMKLSGNTEEETNDWLQCLCNAISHGTGMLAGAGILPTCSVLTPSHVVIFHEDLQTNFCRTLASAPMADLVQVLEDGGAQIYAILVFETSVCKKKWVLYFNTVRERDRYMTTLRETWHALFLVPLPCDKLTDVKLKTRCREGISKLKKQRRV